MAENVIVLLLAFGLLDGQLQLALDLTHKQVVDHYVVGRFLEFILDAH